MLVVRDEKTGEISVVRANADGTPKRTPQKRRTRRVSCNSDRHGDVLDNFFKNFFRQCSGTQPLRFLLHRGRPSRKSLEVMKQLLKDPEANKELLALTRWTPRLREEGGAVAAEQPKKQEPQKQGKHGTTKRTEQDKSEQMRAKSGYQPIDESKINWQELEDRWGRKAGQP